MKQTTVKNKYRNSLIDFLFSFWCKELGIAVLVLLATTLEIRHINRTDWHDVFLYNGDSLTFPMLRESLLRHEHFQWIFSSQLLIFPEAPIYFVSSLLGSIRSSLIINAYINVLLLYLLFRWLAQTLGVSIMRQRIVSACSVLVFLLIALTEQRAVLSSNYNGLGIATFYLFNTYYYGIILISLSVLLLSLKFFK